MNGRIEVLNDSYEKASEGYSAKRAVFETLPDKKEMGILRDAYLEDMRAADLTGETIVNFPGIPNAPQPSLVFQACSVVYAALNHYMEEHDRPSRVRIFCDDEGVRKMYMVVWNLYYATDKDSRMNDGRWD
jgi:hypothetical protein